ncbi:HAD domain-containing protein [Hydrogenophaga soli]
MTADVVHTPLEWGIGMPEPAAATATLFLDFDGVLHPEYGHPSRFFEALPLLATVLLPRPWVEVVVSSNWRYERADAATTGSTTLPATTVTTSATSVWRLKPMVKVNEWLQAEPLLCQRVVGINPLMPDHSQLPDRILAYEREAQCLAWLRAWRPSRLHWLALDDRSWLFSPFCPQLFETDGTQGLQPDQLPALAAQLDAMCS